MGCAGQKICETCCGFWSFEIAYIIETNSDGKRFLFVCGITTKSTRSRDDNLIAALQLGLKKHLKKVGQITCNFRFMFLTLRYELLT